MGEILSHAEVEALLSSIKPSPHHRPVMPPANAPRNQVTTWEQHDFRRAEPLRGEALKVVHALHSNFGQQSKFRLEPLLQTQVEINPIGVCQTTSAEFLATLQPECTICELLHPSLESNSCLIWPRSLLRSIFTKMLGGGNSQNGDGPFSQDLTKIELRLLSKLNDVLLAELADILKTKIVQSHIYDQISSVPDSDPDHLSIWLSFELECGGANGCVHLGLSRVLFGPQTNSFRGKSIAGTDSSSQIGESRLLGIQKVTVELSACLSRLQMRTSDIANLQVGDILMTDLQPTEPVSLKLGDQNLCLAAIGMHSGKKALRLIQTPHHDIG